VAAVILAAAAFAAAGYVIEQHDSVPNAGQVLGYSPPPSPHQSSTGPRRTSSPPTLVVAFLGDDYTAGTRASTPSRRFSTLLCAALHLSERNFGVPRTGYADTRGGTDYRSRIARVIAARPDAVLVSGGRNDIIDDPDTIAANALQLFAKLRRGLPHARLIAISPLWGDSPPPPLLATIARSISTAVRAAGGAYLAVNDPLRGHPSWMADLADPNDTGYAAIERRLQAPLGALLYAGQ